MNKELTDKLQQELGSYPSFQHRLADLCIEYLTQILQDRPSHRWDFNDDIIEEVEPFSLIIDEEYVFSRPIAIQLDGQEILFVMENEMEAYTTDLQYNDIIYLTKELMWFEQRT